MSPKSNIISLSSNVVKRVVPGSVPESMLRGFEEPKTSETETGQRRMNNTPTKFEYDERLIRRLRRKLFS